MHSFYLLFFFSGLFLVTWGARTRTQVFKQLEHQVVDCTRMSLEGWPEHVPPDIDHESMSFTDLMFPILSPQSNILVQGLIPYDHGSDENKCDKMSSSGFNDSIGGGASSTGNYGNG